MKTTTVDLSKYKKPIAVLGIATIIYLFMNSSKAFSAVTADNIKRGCDAWGCGGFGDGRTGHSHQGIDIKVLPGQKILSPISGTVTRFPYPYGDDLRWTGIEIKNKVHHVKIFYISAAVKINSEVKQGQVIGVAQNIASKYSSTMTNHVHVEVRNAKTGALINPETLF